MKEQTRHPAIRQFVEEVCGHVRWKEAHESIASELQDHLICKVEELLREGMDEEGAIREAILQMGDSEQIGQRLHRIHKPRIAWGLLGMIALFIGIGLLAMWGLQRETPPLSGSLLLRKKALSSLLGLVILLAAIQFDYRKLLRFSWFIYGLTAGGMALFHYDWLIEASPLLFAIEAAGIVPRFKKGVASGIYISLLFLIGPSVLYWQSARIAESAVYLCSFVAIMVILRRDYTCWLVSFCVWGGVAIAWLITPFIHGSYYLGRWSAWWTGFLHPSAAPSDVGWLPLRIHEMIQTAGWWGKGFGETRGQLPFLYSDTIYPYIIYSMGWMMGAFVLFLVVILLSLFIRSAIRTGEAYGKGLIAGASGVLGISFLWNIAMSFGYAPFTSMPLPFIGYGDSQNLLQFLAIGLILSVYKRSGLRVKGFFKEQR